MNDMKKRVRMLEEKVKVLEETLERLENRQLSEQMEDYISSKTKSLRTTECVNRMPDKPSLDFDREEESLNHVLQAKRTVDRQIQLALKDGGTFSDDFPDDPSYFNYEVESGVVTALLLGSQERDKNLTKFVGRGLRITSYNGFETDRVIIPNEIDGQPVISIGEKAFMNTTISEVILPKSIRAILKNAFKGCKNLKHIDLPETLEYLGDSCFQSTGITEFSCPNSLRIIPMNCFWQCAELKRVGLGNQIEKLELGAFQDCSNLEKISLPESLQEVGSSCFGGTKITTMIFPSSIKGVSSKIFGSSYTNEITCVFLGKDTNLTDKFYVTFYNVSLVYCLPGSKMQQIARERSIPIKPLSEFKMEEYI